MKWVDCRGCGAEFRVVSDSTQTIEFCPFCGDSVEIENDDDYYDNDD